MENITRGMAVITNHNETGIVVGFYGERAQIERHGNRTHHDYVGGGFFYATTTKCVPDAEVNEALAIIVGLENEVEALAEARKAKGLRIETREEYDMRREVRRLRDQIAKL